MLPFQGCEQNQKGMRLGRRTYFLVHHLNQEDKHNELHDLGIVLLDAMNVKNMNQLLVEGCP
jgi:hypothetical protein